MSGYTQARQASPSEEALWNNNGRGVGADVRIRQDSSSGASSSSHQSRRVRSPNQRPTSYLAASSTAGARTSTLSTSGLLAPSGRDNKFGPYGALNRKSYLSADEDWSEERLPGDETQGMIALAHEKEQDDVMYEGDVDKRSHAISWRGCFNVLTLIVLALGLLTLFAGYPIISHYVSHSVSLDSINGTGQLASFDGVASLIDEDTAEADKAWTNPVNGDTYHLVFSDEFEKPGRTFWEGDDPFWTAVDIWYGATGDYEWYSPEQINTTNGYLQIAMEERPLHNLNFRSGMLQSWNQFCFQGGYIEWSVMQPGTPETTGYWPAIWLMGNLARAGYLGSTDGMWPYSYGSSCDAGIMPNQTWKNGTGPDQAIDSKATYAEKGQISKLNGMRLPACTCSGAGDDHPGPNVHTPRSAPEIDCIEAQIQTKDGTVSSYSSQSLQVAPFDVEYYWGNGTADATVYNADTTEFNSYVGGVYQEAVSAVSLNPDRGFDGTDGQFVTYGIQYDPDWNADGSGSVTWFIDGKATWTVKGSSVGPSADMDIGQRVIPVEPMYIVMNLGMSSGFQPVYFEGHGARDLTFPAYLRVDYVRVYGKDGEPDRISCDPADHPTSNYIKTHPELYYNPNLTLFTDSPYTRPPNSYRDGC